MTWDEEFEEAQRDLSAASRNDTWWRTLPEERRALLGRTGYRAKCRSARALMKAADERCRRLIRTRKARKGDGASAAVSDRGRGTTLAA